MYLSQYYTSKLIIFGDMNIIDIIIAVALIFAFYKGFTKGLFVEVASLVALVGGVFVAVHFSFFVADILSERVSWDENYISIASFAITFAGFVVAISMLGKALTKIADFAALGFVNKLFGGVFGLLKSALIMSVLLVFFTKANQTVRIVDQETLNNSTLYQPIKNIVPYMFPTLFDDIKEIKDEII